MTIDQESTSGLRGASRASWNSPNSKFSRRFKKREFEVITISIYHPKEQAKALEFLQNAGAGMPTRIKESLESEGMTTNNYLYTEPSTDALVQAFDPDWPGPDSILCIGRTQWWRNPVAQRPI